MSDQNVHDSTPESGVADSGTLDELILKVNRATNEIVFTDPKSGKEFKAKFSEEKEPDHEISPPLSAKEFREVLADLTRLGITWNTDIPPSAVVTPGQKTDIQFWEKFTAIQERYPNFPRELGNIILHALLHPKTNTAIIDEKVQAISSLLTQEYRSEFFFKYAVKVSAFEDIDWEVVVKAYEKGTEQMPKIAYALLSLILRSPVNTTLTLEEAASEPLEPEFITVAVNEKLVDNLIRRLTDIKMALMKAQSATSSLADGVFEKEELPNGKLSS